MLAESLAYRFRGDLIAIARREFGVDVRVVPGTDLTAMRGRPVRGTTDGISTIWIADSERGQEFVSTLGHEVAHLVDSNWTEQQCDEFSEAFVAAARFSATNS